MSNFKHGSLTQHPLFPVGLLALFVIACIALLTYAGNGNPARAFDARNVGTLSNQLRQAEVEHEKVTKERDEARNDSDYNWRQLQDRDTLLRNERRKNSRLTSANTTLAADLHATRDTLNKFRQQVWAAFENAGGKAPATHFCFPGCTTCAAAEVATFDFDYWELGIEGIPTTSTLKYEDKHIKLEITPNGVTGKGN